MVPLIGNKPGVRPVLHFAHDMCSTCRAAPRHAARATRRAAGDPLAPKGTPSPPYRGGRSHMRPAFGPEKASRPPEFPFALGIGLGGRAHG